MRLREIHPHACVFVLRVRTAGSTRRCALRGDVLCLMHQRHTLTNIPESAHACVARIAPMPEASRGSVNVGSKRTMPHRIEADCHMVQKARAKPSRTSSWRWRAHAVALLAVATVAVGAFATADMATAQQGPGGLINPQRDCHTVVTCNFRRGGSYRGCLSSYSCRVCRTVASRCRDGGRRGRVCHYVRCGWGGV